MGNYKQLSVWQKSVEFVVEVYKVADALPNHELFALSSQLRRAAVSIPSNIAEGQRRASNKEVIQFMYIAQGSLAEVETQLILVSKLHNIDTSIQLEMASEIGKMLSGLTRSLRGK